jgi:predicted flap endonuclease-1-like 5' DNA nuclease
MGPFRGRFARDRIVEQAAYLSRGDLDGYQARFGNL